jgi:hypothetical protein
LGLTGTWDTKFIEASEARLKEAIQKRKMYLQSSIEEDSEQLQEKGISTYLRGSIMLRLKPKQEQLAFLESWTSPGVPPPPEIEVNSEMEVPIKRDRYKTVDIVGYADIVFFLRTTRPHIFSFPEDNFGKPALEINLPNHTRWNKIWNEPQKIAFDAKSAIPSLGELIRQLKTYKTFCNWPFVIVSPDARFANEISDEGFGFIKYPDCIITLPKKKN